VKIKTLLTTVAVTAALTALSATAQELPKQTFKVLGGFSNLNFSKAVERPFWTEEIPKASGGQIQPEFTTLDQMGLQGTETLRLVRLGVLDFASGNVGYMAADGAAFEGLDLPGVLPDIETARKASEAFKPVLDKLMAQRYNAKLLALWPAPPQVLYCRQEIKGMADLKGKKIRSFAPTLSDLVTALGGTPVQIAFPEVVPALQNGTVDCGITGTLSGNTARWWEVSTHLYPLVVGWAPWFTAVNLNTWKRMDPKTQAFFLENFKNVENKFWEVAAKEGQDGINCNTGKEPCTMGIKGNMKLVDVTDADKAEIQRIAREVVVKKWAARCGADCARDWSASVGRAVGMEAK
jgi:TRAP-type C4-dicarboxylate transport system substrate-binding protein